MKHNIILFASCTLLLAKDNHIAEQPKIVVNISNISKHFGMNVDVNNKSYFLSPQSENSNLNSFIVPIVAQYCAELLLHASSNEKLIRYGFDLNFCAYAFDQNRKKIAGSARKFNLHLFAPGTLHPDEMNDKVYEPLLTLIQSNPLNLDMKFSRIGTGFVVTGWDWNLRHDSSLYGAEMFENTK